MILIGREILEKFKTTHTDTTDWIDTWVFDVEHSVWKTPQDIKNKYSSVSFVKEEVIFNVKGNRYRLITRVYYPKSIVAAIWAGSHAGYDKRNKKR